MDRPSVKGAKLLSSGRNYNSPFRKEHTVKYMVNGKEVFSRTVYLPQQPKEILGQYELELRRSMKLHKSDSVSFEISSLG